MKKIIAIAALVAAPVLFAQNKLTTAKDTKVEQQVKPAPTAQKSVTAQKTDAKTAEVKKVEANKASLKETDAKKAEVKKAESARKADAEKKAKVEAQDLKAASLKQ